MEEADDLVLVIRVRHDVAQNPTLVPEFGLKFLGFEQAIGAFAEIVGCLLYTSDAADE